MKIDFSRKYKEGQEVAKDTFALEYVCYNFSGTKKPTEYTHLRVMQRKDKKEIYLIDVALSGKVENKRSLVRGVSPRFKEIDELLTRCEKKRNLVSLFKDEDIDIK